MVSGFWGKGKGERRHGGSWQAPVTTNEAVPKFFCMYMHMKEMHHNFLQLCSLKWGVFSETMMVG